MTMRRRTLIIGTLLCAIAVLLSGSGVLAYPEQDTQTQNSYTLHGQTDTPPHYQTGGGGPCPDPTTPPTCGASTQYYFNSWSTAYADVGWLGVRQAAAGDWCADGTGSANKGSTGWNLQYTGPGPWLRASTGYLTAEDCGNHGGGHSYYALGWHYLDTGPGLDFGTEAYA